MLDLINSTKVKLQKVIDKNTPIVVYCSIGVRSEKIGELIKLGYKMSITCMAEFFEYKNEREKLLTKIK
jgi:predicted sulfurtransferase